MDAKNEGKSILLSSHILSEVERLCDKVGIIRQGQIIETGTLDELRHLTRNKLACRNKAAIPALGNVNGVRDIVMKDQALSFQVDTDELDNVMKYISQFGIVKLESAPPTLEDLFMSHYEGEGRLQILGREVRYNGEPVLS